MADYQTKELSWSLFIYQTPIQFRLLILSNQIGLKIISLINRRSSSGISIHVTTEHAKINVNMHIKHISSLSIPFICFLCDIKTK